jgi:hypothetical protein
MYRVATIPHAMKPNAMLTKKQSCGSMNLSFGSNSSDRL